MKKFIHYISALILLICVSMIAGCGDEKDGLPYWIEADDPVIQLSDAAEDERCLVYVTLFDSKGDLLEEGNMIFTVSDITLGGFPDDKGVLQSSVDVDIEDGVAEALFVSTNTPGTAVVYAYCPGYPNDKVVSTSITIVP